MNGKVKQITVAALEWRIGIFWFCLFSINSLCSAIIIAIEGKDWSAMSHGQRFIIVVLILMNWTNLLMAFLSKAAQRIKQNPDDLDLAVDTPEPKTDISPTPTKQ